MRFFYLLIFIILISLNIFPKVNDFQVLWLIGNIDNKHDISMVLFPFDLNNKKEIFGYYFYQKSNTPIFLKGDLIDRYINLTEYLDNGKKNAIFKGEFHEDKDIISGKWIMYKKELTFQLYEAAFILDPDFKIDILIDIKNCLREYYTKNQSSIGTLLFSKKKNNYQFAFDLYSNAKPDHIGIYEDILKIHNTGIHYFEADPEVKEINDNCIIFFLFFQEKIFVFQYGNPALIDFGMDVNAEGVYLNK